MSINDVVIHFLDGEWEAHLPYDNITNYADNDSFAVEILRDANNSFGTYQVVSDGDLFTILINTGTNGTNLTVTPRKEITMKIIFTTGITRYVILV